MAQFSVHQLRQSGFGVAVEPVEQFLGQQAVERIPTLPVPLGQRPEQQLVELSTGVEY